jgi:multiple sugar transport system substrate-binding protein
VRPTHRRIVPLVLAAGALFATAACGGGFHDSSSDAPQKTGKADLKVLIASSGDAETDAVKKAVQGWAGKSGNTATVTVAQNMDQQLGQAFAASQPPDVFYLDASKFADYAAQGALYPYGDKAAGASDFYPNLKEAFTFDGKVYCAPKDFSTLALEINTGLWEKAGLSQSDIPTTWDQLTATLTTLKSKLAGVTPLVISPGHDRVDAFIIQAGGHLVDQDGKVTADSPENLTGLRYAQGLLQKGLLKYSSDVGAGWGGEAFGKGKTVMTIEGNWIKGAMKSDFPNVKYQVAPLPAGASKGSLAFTQCWGIPASTKYKQQAIDFVNAMTSTEQQLAFADAFGVMPSRQSAKDSYVQKFSDDKVFLEAAEYAVGPIKEPKTTQVLADYDNELAKLAKTDPKAILSRLQKNMVAATGS